MTSSNSAGSGAGKSRKFRVPAVARKWIVNFGSTGVLVLAVLAAHDVWNKKSGKEILLPERLSCSVSQAPPVWDKGQVHFDFENHLMATNAAHKKVYTGTKAWTEGRDRLLSLNTSLDVSTGNLIQKSDVIRIHPISRLKDVWQVRISSAVNTKEKPMELACLGRL